MFYNNYVLLRFCGSFRTVLVNNDTFAKYLRSIPLFLTSVFDIHWLIVTMATHNANGQTCLQKYKGVTAFDTNVCGHLAS